MHIQIWHAILPMVSHIQLPLTTDLTVLEYWILSSCRKSEKDDSYGAEQYLRVWEDILWQSNQDHLSILKIWVLNLITFKFAESWSTVHESPAFAFCPHYCTFMHSHIILRLYHHFEYTSNSKHSSHICAICFWKAYPIVTEYRKLRCKNSVVPAQN